MEVKKLQLSGLDHGSPSNLSMNKAAQIINMRPEKGAWRPVPEKTKLFNYPSGTWLNIWLHDQDGINNYIGLYSAFNLKLIDISLGTSKNIKSYTGEVKVEFLKR